jgi:hypothetical protein
LYVPRGRRRKGPLLDLVYIASPSFSGSTLLAFLLGAHREIATIGELKWGRIDLNTYACSCGRLLKDCGFWARVESHMRARGLPFDLRRPATDFRFRGHPIADRVSHARVRGAWFERLRNALLATLGPCRRSWESILGINCAMMEIIRDMKSGRMFLDASKDPIRLNHLMNSGRFHIRVIQLIRDGRAVVNSAMRNENRTPAFAAREWRHTHLQIERLAQRLGPEQSLAVRYEDLCLDRQGTMQRLSDFLDIDRLESEGDFRAVDHHILGNKMRLRPITEIRLDDKWRTQLTAHQLAVFDRIAGHLNRRYGYE